MMKKAPQGAFFFELRQEYKNVARRPDAKEGGREEEENRPGISTGRQAPGRPRNMKKVRARKTRNRYERSPPVGFPRHW
ncbi:hypothetical protein SRS16CHR_05379 [Variovorax sp. SRS16]|nr:hypothetical protein SRS16CHR_05379 [Variovorax sp. SRS16]